MRIALTLRQIRHFYEIGSIEFAEFLTLEECTKIKVSLENLVAKRLSIASGMVNLYPKEQIYGKARDCWRDDNELKQYLRSPKFASTAAMLCNKKFLQIGCDQLLPPNYLLEPENLDMHLSFQNLACGCLIALDGDQIGTARFFQTHLLPCFPNTQLLIAYGSFNTVYVHNPVDPLNGYLQKFGYSFGDRLYSTHHPSCFLGE
jgi:hypothetical protein